MKRLLALALTSSLLVGCVTLYKPNTIQSPLLKKKGDFNSSAVLGLTGTGFYNLQAAYAISDHMGIMANGMYHHRRTDGGDSSVEKLNIYSGEIGAGYFKLLGNEKRLFQFYGGIGTGNTLDRIHNTQLSPPEVKAKYNNVFLQPGFAWVGDKITMAVDLRCNYVNINNIHAYLYNQFEWWNTDFHYYSDTSFYFMNLEPTFTMKHGKGNMKGFLQGGATIPTIHSDTYFLANSTSALIIPLLKFSVGVSFTLGRKNKLESP